MYRKYDFSRDYISLCQTAQNGEQILKVIKKSYRKERYMELDQKSERYLRDEKGNLILDENGQRIVLPAREVSLEKFNEDGHFFASNIPSAETVFFEENFPDSKLLEQCFEALTPNEKSLIDYFYFKNMTQKEIAETLGKSQQSVSRYINGAIKKMKATIFNIL